MVAEVRRGLSLRAVARQFGVRLAAVQHWVKRAGDERLDRVVWSDRPRGCRSAPNRTSPRMEERIVEIRRVLRDHSALGECGPEAIRQELLRRRFRDVPSARTIARILERRGALDGKVRIRRSPPPKGWYLPKAADVRAELDSFDMIEDLVIAGGADVNVLTGISLHGGLCAAWPRTRITAKFTVEALLEHWRECGLPTYAKFDNDTVFQGTHRHADSFGRVIRVCLSLGVTPVFAPPRETGFQADIESFNGRWQAGVWKRFQFPNLAAVQRQARLYVQASRQKSATRIQAAPGRSPFPPQWQLNLQAPLKGTVIFLRRTDLQGRVNLLGHSYLSAHDWTARLVRAEVDLTAEEIRFYALRRRAPHEHRFISKHHYETPRKKFIE